MFYPTYAWVVYNWYPEKWWMNDNSSCIRDRSVKAEDLERLIEHAIILDDNSRIDENRRDELNIGKIVSI